MDIRARLVCLERARDVQLPPSRARLGPWSATKLARGGNATRRGDFPVAPSLFTREKRRDQSPREEETQEIQTGASGVGKPKKKEMPGPRLEVLKVGGCSRDAIKKARDYSTPQYVMTVAQMAEYLKVQPSTIHRWARKGKIPAFKIGTDWRFDRDAIEKLMIDRQVKLPS